MRRRRIPQALAFVFAFGVAGCRASGPEPLPSIHARHPYTPSTDEVLVAERYPLFFERLEDLREDDPLLFQALETFRTAPRVECELVGNVRVSDQALATEILLDRENAPELVAWIAPHATLEGRIALLNVIACTHPNAVQHEREGLLRDFGDQAVSQLCGCLGDSVTVASLLEQEPNCELRDR